MPSCLSCRSSILATGGSEDTQHIWQGHYDSAEAWWKNRWWQIQLELPFDKTYCCLQTTCNIKKNHIHQACASFVSKTFQLHTVPNHRRTENAKAKRHVFTFLLRQIHLHTFPCRLGWAAVGNIPVVFILCSEHDISGKPLGSKP